ncbi:hypothetical protein BGX28_009175 [Mortierella sp. GBA30]|nr:hypothetical protein BGX28_009175 [Mortierella sp. GBA30]
MSFSYLVSFPKTESNRTALVEAGALEILVNVLKDKENREKSHRYAAVSICELISGSEALHPDLIRVDLIRTLAEMSRLSFGNANMPKICLQSLVRLIVTMDDEEDIHWYLSELLDYDIVLLIATYIRSDDFELVYWAIGLMHEFAIKGVALEEFKAVNGLCRSLNVLLAADESYISRVVLRTLKYMMLQDPIFQVEALNAGIGLRLAKCLASKDDDIKYWSLSLTHEFVRHPKWRKQFIESGAFGQVINLGLSNATRQPLKLANEVLPAEDLVVDILIMMWSSSEFSVNVSAFSLFSCKLESELDMLMQTPGISEATCVFLQMESMTSNLRQNRLAVVLAEIAKTSGKDVVTE